MPRLTSMTGHGLGTAEIGSGTVEVEVRAVNHRGFEARSRLPAELAEHGAVVEEIARRRLVRGRVEILVRLDAVDTLALALDVSRARAAFEELISLRDALAPREPIPLALLGSVPGLFVPRSIDGRAARAGLSVATEAACVATQAMRDTEGGALALDLAARAGQVMALLGRVEVRTPACVEQVRQRLTDRVQKMLGPGAPLDPGRLEHEVVLFADRCDVAEECTRLRCHGEQLKEAIAEGPEPTSGRRLDFLLQEMQREVNTIGQKCSDVEISRAVIDMKLAVEQMREQVQNLL